MQKLNILLTIIHTYLRSFLFILQFIVSSKSPPRDLLLPQLRHVHSLVSFYNQL